MDAVWLCATLEQIRCAQLESTEGGVTEGEEPGKAEKDNECSHGAKGYSRISVWITVIL